MQGSIQSPLEPRIPVSILVLGSWFQAGLNSILWRIEFNPLWNQEPRTKIETELFWESWFLVPGRIEFFWGIEFNPVGDLNSILGNGIQLGRIEFNPGRGGVQFNPGD